MLLPKPVVTIQPISHFKKQVVNKRPSSFYSTTINTQKSSLTNSRVKANQVPHKSLDKKNLFRSQLQSNQSYYKFTQKRASLKVGQSIPKSEFPHQRNKIIHQGNSKIIHQQNISKKVPKFILEKKFMKNQNQKSKQQLKQVTIIKTQIPHLKLQNVNNLYLAKPELQPNDNCKNSIKCENPQYDMEISFRKDGPVFYRNPSQPGIFLCDFKIIRFVRQSKLGQQFLALHRQSCFLIILRRIKKEDLRKKNRDLLLIKQLKQSLKNDTGNQNHNEHNGSIRRVFGFFNDQRFFYTVFQCTQEKQLTQLIFHQSRTQKINDNKILEIVYEINEFLRKIHKKGQFHGQLKPKNVLLTYNCVKIIGMQGFNDKIYSLDENTNKRKTLSKQFDMWSLGIIVYQLLQQKMFDIKNDLCLSLIKDPQALIYSKAQKNINIRSKQIKQLLIKLLNPIQRKRITSQQLGQLEFMKELFSQQYDVQNQ